ncbi:MAG: response regulator [Elusimicrobia bacterium]|nr:response regulator [Elusimicrobiota bacterium]
MSKKILIIDDDRMFLNTAEIFMKGKGFEVITAENGDNANEIIEKEKPDTVILDVQMPGKSGFDVCREIKKNDATKDTTVIIFSGKIEAIEKGFDYGADDCFTKPLDWNTFVDRIEELNSAKDK